MGAMMYKRGDSHRPGFVSEGSTGHWRCLSWRLCHRDACTEGRNSKLPVQAPAFPSTCSSFNFYCISEHIFLWVVTISHPSLKHKFREGRRSVCVDHCCTFIPYNHTQYLVDAQESSVEWMNRWSLPLQPLLAALLLGSRVTVWSVSMVETFTGQCSVKGSLVFCNFSSHGFYFFICKMRLIKTLIVVYCCVIHDPNISWLK